MNALDYRVFCLNCLQIFLLCFGVGFLSFFFLFWDCSTLGIILKHFLGVKTKTQVSQFPAECPSDQLFSLLSHTWWTFPYLIKEEQHVQGRVLPWLGHAPVLCMMQLCPGRGGSLHLASNFLTPACNCQTPFGHPLLQVDTTQGASPCVSQCVTYACWVVFLRCVHTYFVSSWCKQLGICFMQGGGAVSLQRSTVSVFAWISRKF